MFFFFSANVFDGRYSLNKKKPDRKGRWMLRTPMAKPAHAPHPTLVTITEGDLVHAFIDKIAATRGLPFCKVSLGNKQYWKTVCNTKFHRVIASHTTDGVYTGFALIDAGVLCTRDGCKKSDQAGWKIELICSHARMGTTIMQEIKRQAILERMSYISLSALPEVITYYGRHGFVIGDMECIQAGSSDRILRTLGTVQPELRRLQLQMDKPRRMATRRSAVDPGEKLHRDTLARIRELEAIENGVYRELAGCSFSALQTNKPGTLDHLSDGVYMVLTLPSRPEFEHMETVG